MQGLCMKNENSGIIPYSYMSKKIRTALLNEMICEADHSKHDHNEFVLLEMLYDDYYSICTRLNREEEDFKNKDPYYYDNADYFISIFCVVTGFYPSIEMMRKRLSEKFNSLEIKDHDMLSLIKKERIVTREVTENISSLFKFEHKKPKEKELKQTYSDQHIKSNLTFWLFNINMTPLPVDTFYTESFNPASFFNILDISILENETVRIAMENGTYHPQASGPLYPDDKNKRFFIDINKETFTRIVEADFENWDKLDSDLCPKNRLVEDRRKVFEAC